jgi:hypothetical protein
VALFLFASHWLTRVRPARLASRLALVLVGAAAVVTTHAANVTWGGARNITADTDVSLDGTLVRAANLTPLTGNSTAAASSFPFNLNLNITLNGVTFVAAPRTNADLTTMTLDNGDVLVASDTSRVGPTSGADQFQGFGGPGATVPTLAPFNSLSTNYQMMLSTAWWNDGDYLNPITTARYTWTLNNLTIGQQYELQVWVNDSRLSNLGQNNPDLHTTVSDGVTTVNLQHNVNNALGGAGQYAIGTFTAGAASQVLTVTGGNAPGVDTDAVSCTALLNAYQLRTIAPASAPVITNVLQAGAEIILQGTNGPPNGAYQIIRSADLTTPAGDWPGVGRVRSFDASGNFSFTNALPAGAAGFYRLRVVSSAPVYPPALTLQPQDVAIAAGQNAMFNVAASGTAPLTYFWYCNTNTLLAGGPDATITITNAQVADSGKISVTVSNLVGVTNSGYATLLVTNVPAYPPVLTSQPQDVAIAVGQNATFSVTASGTAPLTYSWYYNTNTLLASGSNASLTVTNAQLSDAGKYSVTVTNIAGTTNSVFATLTVTNSSQPPFIVTQPASLNVVTGQTASFNVTATGALPLSYQWYYNTNTPLAWGTNAMRSIANAQPTDAGAYSVTITNLYGATNSAFATLTLSEQAARVKPRIIATTDGEVDDRSTMVRFLVYSCDYDVAGIVQVNSRYQPDGHSKDKWVETVLGHYHNVRTNLLKHNPDYPTTNYLMSVLRVGNENRNDLWVAPPNMATTNTPGEQLIIQTLLDDDPRPVHVPSWGGANTTASALWRLKYSGDYTPEQFNKAVSKIRIYCIWYQDGGGYYIQTNIPQAYINEAYRWDQVWDYGSVGSGSANPTNYTGSDAYLIFPAGSESTNDIQYYMTGAWLTNNVKTGHGPLGAYTPQKYISEGDTPSFLHLINNGLEAQEDYTLGGWGGRSAYDNPTTYPNHLKDRSPDIYDDGNVNKMYWRWIPAAENDFAARMDWCVATNYAGANHPPVARVNGSLRRDVSPGQTVMLDATPSTDPDGHSLIFNWWQYYDADSSTNKVTIANSSSMNNASFVVPGATNQIGKQMHIILQVTDNGTPPLTGYQRIICNIK